MGHPAVRRKEGNAGRIGYGTFTAGALDIVGAGTTAGNDRKVVIWAEGGLTVKSRPDIAAADFADLTRRYGVELIAEKVENERQVIDVLELDVSYAQGHLFGEPKPIRDDIAAETAPPAEFNQAPLRRRAG